MTASGKRRNVFLQGKVNTSFASEFVITEVILRSSRSVENYILVSLTHLIVYLQL